VHKLAMVLVFDIYDTPTILTATNGLAIDNDVTFRSHDSERDDILFKCEKVREYSELSDVPG